MMGHRERLKDGYEWELTSKWRKRGYLNIRSGNWKKVKRRLNKRNRKNEKTKITEELKKLD